ncbi:MAG: FCD domain-containing protein [Chloroflexi bacterium]|nr:FCD domain-containing protein [Chloroflexota bacterium]
MADAGLLYMEPDRVFHQQIFSRISNHLLHELMNLFWTVLSYALTVEQLVPREVFVAQAYKHRPILDAILAGDTNLASKRLRESITRHFRHYAQL